MSIVLSPVTIANAAKIMNKITNLLHPAHREDYHTNAASLFSANAPLITFTKNGKFFTVKQDDQIVFSAASEVGFMPLISVYIKGDWENRLLTA